MRVGVEFLSAGKAGCIPAGLFRPLAAGTRGGKRSAPHAGGGTPCGGGVLHFRLLQRCLAPNTPDVTPCRTSTPMSFVSHVSRLERPM